MRYEQSKERSAELLRAALAKMGQHDAAFNPLTFAVWYEVVAGINSRLTRDIEAFLLAEPRLGDDRIARLYREHISPVDEVAMQRASGEFQRVMSGMAESAARTGDKAGAFNDQLSGLTQALRADEDSALGSVLGQALAGTVEMKESAASLQQQISASRQEIERLRDDLSRARDEALVDPLTRVLNRKGFDQKLQAMLDSAPGPGRTHCLILLDIDRFKSVNDSHGHVMGDRVLQVVAGLLRSGVSDATHSVARYGGEEFACLMPNSTPQQARDRAESMRLDIKAAKTIDRRNPGPGIMVTVSAGVAQLRASDDGPSLVARADVALYAAKQGGRDRVQAD